MVVDPGDADRARRRSRRSPTSCSCTTSPTRERARAVRAAHRLARRRDRATARRRRPARRGGARRSSASTRSIRSPPTSRAALHRPAPRPHASAETEQRWIGWERKRGKLEQLLAMLADGLGLRPSSTSAAVSTVGRGRALRASRSTATRGCRPGACASWSASPRIRTTGRSSRPTAAASARGYGILQPHVATPLPRARERHALPLAVRRASAASTRTASPAPRSTRTCSAKAPSPARACSHVQAVHAVLGGRLPDEPGAEPRPARRLARALRRGDRRHGDRGRAVPRRRRRLARAPLDARRLAAAAVPAAPAPLSDPRRSTAGRCSTTCAARWSRRRRSRCSSLALATDVVSPWAALALVALAFVGRAADGRDRRHARRAATTSRRGHFYRQCARRPGARAAERRLAARAAAAARADGDRRDRARASGAPLVSRRRLLEWTTAAAAQASATTDLPTLVRKHWGVPLAAVALLGRADGARARRIRCSPRVLCVAWALSPVWTWWVSRPRPQRRADAAARRPTATTCYGVARDTWRLFERCVGAEDHHLPPDNLQIAPHDMVAHRTSPTNIGLYLLATTCAPRIRLDRHAEMRSSGSRRRSPACRPCRAIAATSSTGTTRERSQPLLPQYVSTRRQRQPVHAPARASPRPASSSRPRPGDDSALRRELARSKARIAALRAGQRAARAGRRARRPARRCRPARERSRRRRRRDQAARRRARRAARLAARGRRAAAPTVRAPRLAWAIEDRLSTLRSALRDRERHRHDAAARLGAVAATCQRLAREADFAFLYNRKRRLFHIGFRVAEHQLDAGFYDLLASEARADQPVGDRQGRRARGPLGRARPAVLRRSATSPACAPGRARCSST